MTETRFYEPVRLSTPPKPLFLLKSLDPSTWLVAGGERGGQGEQEAGGVRAGWVRETGEERAGSRREIHKGKLSLFVTAYHPVKKG